MFQQLMLEFFTVFAILQLVFGFFEYQYKPDIFYVVGRLFTAEKYIIPSIILPITYIILSRLVMFLFF